MIKISHKTIIFSLLALLFIPAITSAHQPRIVESDAIKVVDPEISKAYYATLNGSPHTYTIDSPVDFDLYVSILVPDIASADRSTTAEVFKEEAPIAIVGGNDAPWRSFFEPFGQSSYLDGGEYKSRAEAGVYTIIVKSENNDRKYSLAIGEIEAFDGAEGVNALSIIPELKRDFFEESSISFIKSPFGWGLIVMMYLFAGIVGLLYRAILKRFAKNSPRGATRNIGKSDRLLRLAIGAGLILWAITTTWNPLLIFFSGFALFEGIFSWCGLYAALGKNTCPIK